ncbi:cupin domain-containing protein [Lacinutrix sp. Hel_I_90]|uniref:cupin domain-containing protein n=1 Tax=Lacinutrix sp. Hel_I_90 TaxID=1249999 RepID=UPI0005CA8E04|nr:cupin domain-containing protein [Lacinutrix sp. Hel_I_90]
MNTINNEINMDVTADFKSSKLLDINAKEVILINLKKNAIFPEHTSPRDATLLILEGKIIFHINNSEFNLEKHQTFNFPKNEKHWVAATKNSKFLIIR